MKVYSTESFFILEIVLIKRSDTFSSSLTLREWTFFEFDLAIAFLTAESELSQPVRTWNDINDYYHDIMYISVTKSSSDWIISFNNSFYFRILNRWISLRSKSLFHLLSVEALPRWSEAGGPEWQKLIFSLDRTLFNFNWNDHNLKESHQKNCLKCKLI